jgi:hypothetical protein
MCLIQVGRLGVRIAAPEQLDAARERFVRDRCVRLEGFVAPDLLSWIHQHVGAAPFDRFVHPLPGGDVVELVMQSAAVESRLHFLVNDPRLFAAVERITGCARVGRYLGRVYQMVPALGHRDDWHHDVDGNRLATLSVNLTGAPFEGGVLQIMEWQRRAMIHQVANTGPGDAILFAIGMDLRHRVTEVTGTVPKVAFAGWFEREPAYAEWLRRR